MFQIQKKIKILYLFVIGEWQPSRPTEIKQKISYSVTETGTGKIQKYRAQTCKPRKDSVHRRKQVSVKLLTQSTGIFYALSIQGKFTITDMKPIKVLNFLILSFFFYFDKNTCFLQLFTMVMPKHGRKNLIR